MTNMELLSKPLKRVMVINWSRFAGALDIKVEKSTLITGNNTVGKTTLLDAISYALAGNTDFNKAAGANGKEHERNVLDYVRGNTKSEGEKQYLRPKGEVVCYIALEFYSHADRFPFVVGACVESPDISTRTTSWFVIKDASISDVNFYVKEGSRYIVTPKNSLKVKGAPMKGNDFMPKEKGTEQIARALGIRCTSVREYCRRLLRLMTSKQDKNTDTNVFIRDNVFPEKPLSVDSMKAPMAALSELRETFNKIEERIKLLEKIEPLMKAYEDRVESQRLSKAVILYQECAVKHRDSETNARQIGETKEKEERLKVSYGQAEDEYAKANDKFVEARTNFQKSNYYAMAESLKNEISELERKIRDAEDEERKIKALKSTITEMLPYISAGPALRSDIAALDSTDIIADRKYQAVMEVKGIREETISSLQKEEGRLETEEKAYKEKISDIREQIKALEKETHSFPADVVRARDMVNNELAKRNIPAKVCIFAELVEKVSDPEWRDVIEAYLKNQKLNLIIDKRYVKAALDAFYKLKIKNTSLVLSDRIKDCKVDEGSAAGLLVIHDEEARMYADYLLGRIHLCDTIEELHDHPLGALMRDGALAKNYSMRNLPINDVNYYLGHEAIKLQLKKNRDICNRLVNELDKLLEEKEDVIRRRRHLRDAEIKDGVRFEALEEKPGLQTKKVRAEALYREQANDPNFMTLQNLVESAERAYKESEQKKQEIYAERGECRRRIEALELRAEAIEREEQEARDSFNSYINDYPEVRTKAMEEYARRSRNSANGRAINNPERVIMDHVKEVEDAKRKMEDLQLEYCKVANISASARGPEYIRYYRKEMSQLTAIDSKQVLNSIHHHEETLERVAATEFISALCEAMSVADSQRRAMNQKLAGYKFGNDIYSFTMTPRKDMDVFFRLKKQLYDGTPEDISRNYEGLLHNEEFIADLKAFVNEILKEGNELEYTDYRRYYTYDINVRNLSTNTDTRFSKMSASGGEKKTPCSILLAASLMLNYPDNSPCARMAFIDEAFSELDAGRIEQLVKYFEDNGLQIIYAAPPEKINTIGKHIDTTISMYSSNGYSYAVEGLLDGYRIRMEKAAREADGRSEEDTLLTDGTL